MKKLSVPFSRVFPPSEEAQHDIQVAVSKVLSSGQYINGPFTERFRSEFAQFVGVSDVITVGNGTDALIIALKALNVGLDDVVVTVANAGGYASTAIRAVGATPLYVEIQQKNLLIDAGFVKDLVGRLETTPRAMIVTHLFGVAAPIQELASFCSGQGILLLEDCAQAIGVRPENQHVGTFGDVGTFSFYPTKNLGGMGDSGAIVTNNREVAERARMLAQYGWGPNRYVSLVGGGLNSRMDELQAAILQVLLPHTEELNSRRTQIFEMYCRVSPQLKFPHREESDFNGHLAILVTKNRAGAMEVLRRHGVEGAVHYPVPDFLQPGFRVDDYYLPITIDASDSVLSLPVFPSLSDEEIATVCGALERIDQEFP